MKIWDVLDRRFILLSLGSSVIFSVDCVISGDLAYLLCNVLIGLVDLYVLGKIEGKGK